VESDIPKKPQKKLTAMEVQEKIRNWCAYQERSPLETKYKLREYGLTNTEIEQTLAHLIAENFINEERFASAFARGKFRIKKWGRQRIKAELRMRKISEYSINKALKQIDDTANEKTIRDVMEKKLKTLREKNPVKKKYKLLSYGVSRGFEKDRVAEILKEMLNSTDY
jgi:regulatory protein